MTGEGWGGYHQFLTHTIHREVLNSILNPNLPLGEGLFDPEEKVEEEKSDKDDAKVKDLEAEAVKAAEAGDVKKALDIFDKVYDIILDISSLCDFPVSQVVSLAPDRPASYNNRAQALRLAGRPDSALKDLDKAIQLSQGKGRSGSSALCQRGVLNRKVVSSSQTLVLSTLLSLGGSGR